MSTADAYDVLAKGYYEARKYNQGMGYFYNCLSEWPSTLKLLGNVRGKKILDVGCGPGLYASLLIKKGAVVKGMDISKELIGIAKKEAPAAEFIIGDAERLPYKNSEFDIVIQPTELNGLKKPSIIRLSKLATIDKELIIGRLGELDINQTDLVNKNLIHLLKLDLKQRKT